MSTPEEQANPSNEINGDAKPAEDATDPIELTTIKNAINGGEKPDGEAISISMDTKTEAGNPCKVYKYRWVILGLFCVCSALNAFQWIQFSIITAIIARYYHVSEEMVDMTSLIFMIAYIPLIFPVTYLVEKKGLRLCVILGSFGTALGAWIKILSTSPDLFYVAFIGQTVAAVAQTFILGIPSLLAALWFGPDQCSTATSIGVFGNQLGVAAGFLLPTLLVKNGTTESMGHDLSVMFYGTGAVTGIIFIAVLLMFHDKPPTPPSMAQMALLTADQGPYINSIKNLMTNKGYNLLLLSYGMNVGVFYAISTLLSSFIAKCFPENEADAGSIGLMIVVSGMVGSVIGGFVLDKTKKFKETTLVLYFLSFVGMIMCTIALPYGGHIAYIYFCFSALGFFMTGYLPVGFEFAAELTYPENEGTSSGLLNASAQLFGIIMTPLSRCLLNKVGDIGANLALTAILLVGLVMTALIKSDLKRTAAHNATESPSVATTKPVSLADGIAIASAQDPPF